MDPNIYRLVDLLLDYREARLNGNVTLAEAILADAFVTLDDVDKWIRDGNSYFAAVGPFCGPRA